MDNEVIIIVLLIVAIFGIRSINKKVNRHVWRRYQESIRWEQDLFRAQKELMESGSVNLNVLNVVPRQNKDQPLESADGHHG